VSAVLAPRADTPQRYADKTTQERARLIRAETQLATRLHRAGRDSAFWSCHVCHAGRVLVERIEQAGRITVVRTRGKCTTAGCLDWED